MDDGTANVRGLHVHSRAQLPVAYEFPRAGILRRLCAGLAVLGAAVALAFLGGLFWIAAAALALFGGFIVASNFRALVDSQSRVVTLDREKIRIRYGFSERSYGYLDYSDYYIATLGPRQFLTALPVESRFSEGRFRQRARATFHDRSAVIAPVPPLATDPAASLAEWQSLLNSFRRIALKSAGLAPEGEREELAGVGTRGSRPGQGNVQHLWPSLS